MTETCPECGAEIEGNTAQGAKVKLGLHRRAEHGVVGKHNRDDNAAPPDTVGALDAVSPDSLFATPPPTESVGPPAVEVPPAPGGVPRSAPVAPRRRGLLGGLRDKLRDRKDTTTVPGRPATGEKVPKPAKAGRTDRRRVSAAETISDVWGFSGSVLRQTGRVPTGRILEFQGPAAGEMLDEVVKGTALDRLVIQRVVGARSTLDVAVALMGPPLITWQMENAIAAGNQERLSQLELALKTVVKNALPVMVPAMKKARAREAAAQTAIAELLDADDLAALGVEIVNGTPIERESGRQVDVGDIFVAMLFADWEPPGAVVPENREDAESV